MPTASTELRKFAEKNFGSFDTQPVCNALEQRGFVQTRDWCWKRVNPPNEFEWNCINFLIEEWDWGGYED